MANYPLPSHGTYLPRTRPRESIMSCMTSRGNLKNLDDTQDKCLGPTFPSPPPSPPTLKTNLGSKDSILKVYDLEQDKFRT